MLKIKIKNTLWRVCPSVPTIGTRLPFFLYLYFVSLGFQLLTFFNAFSVNFLQFFSPGSGSPFGIRIQEGHWMRIHSDPDPQHWMRPFLTHQSHENFNNLYCTNWSEHLPPYQQQLRVRWHRYHLFWLFFFTYVALTFSDVNKFFTLKLKPWSSPWLTNISQ